jgi:hypothetical protein
MHVCATREKGEVVANCDDLQRLRFSPALPHAFTEHGAITVASVLNTSRAIEASVYVVRAFVKLRKVLGTHKEMAQKLAEPERKLETHDARIRSLFNATRELMAPPVGPRRHIGFQG